MNVIFLGLNYSAEPVGIGHYTAGLATALGIVSLWHAASHIMLLEDRSRFRWRRVRRSLEDGVRGLCQSNVTAATSGW